MGFQHLTEEERKAATEKSNRTRRSEQLKKAWAIASELKSDFENGKPASDIAKENNISERSVYRIVRGK